MSKKISVTARNYRSLIVFGLILAVAGGPACADSRFPQVSFQNARRLLETAEKRKPGYYHRGIWSNRELSITEYKFPAISMPALDGIFDAHKKTKMRRTTVEMRVLGSAEESSRGIRNSYSHPSYELRFEQGWANKHWEYLEARISVMPRTKKARLIEAKSLHNTEITHSVVPPENPASPYWSKRDIKRQLRLSTTIGKAKAWRFASFTRRAIAKLALR